MSSSQDDPMDTDDSGQKHQAAADPNALMFAGTSVDPPIVSSQPQPLSANTVSPGWNQSGGGRMEMNLASDNGPTSLMSMTYPPTSVNSESQTDGPPRSPGTMPAAYNVQYYTNQSGGGRMEVNPGWNQSGGGRMEVNPGGSHGSDNGPTSPSYPPTSPLTSVNSESQTDRPAQSPGTMPAAFNVAEGTGRVRCHVDVLGWPQDEQKRQLEKALQSWFNRNETMSNTSCSIESLSDTCAVVIIEPDSALEHLMSEDITLLVKDKTTVTLRFLPGAEIQTPKPTESFLPAAEIQTPTPDSRSLEVKTHKESQSTAAEPRRQETTPPQRGQDTDVRGQETKVSASFPQRGQEVSVPFPPRGQEVSDPFPPRGQEVSAPFPLSSFVYLNQAYREEMKRIERDNGVTITTEVKVSFEVDQKNNKNNNGSSPNPARALAEFTTLAQKCLSDLDSVTVPLPRSATDQGDWRRVLQNVLREDSRLVLSTSCREMSLNGPSKSVADVRESLPTPPSTTSTNGSFSAAAARRDRHVEAQEIGMLRKDPSVSGGLPMHQSHWKTMNMTFDRVLANIKTKYSVSVEPEFSRDEVTVRVKAAGRSSTVANSLESHAFRALLRLYQKVVMSSTMGFSPQLPDKKAQKVADKIQQDTAALHLGVGVRDDHGYLGLPQTNLQGPAVDAVDRELGKPAFKDRDNKTKRGHASHSDEQSARTAAVARGATAAGEAKEPCPICLENRPQMEKLKCGHELCKDCKIQMVEISGPTCPVCKAVFGKIQGNQPPGTMSWHSDRSSLPGFYQCGKITINYNIPNGTQTDKHPNPGKYYYGTQRTAYLPDNNEGREVVRLLKKAFDQKLIFTVGTSRTTGSEDQVTWNDIHHKTCMSGGPQGFGYPDDNYLSRVRDELKDKGIK